MAGQSQDGKGAQRRGEYPLYDDMIEYHAEAYHNGQGMPAEGYRSSMSSLSQTSDPTRPLSPGLVYPSRPSSLHSSPSYYSTHQPGLPLYYQPPNMAQMPPMTTMPYEPGLVRRQSAPITMRPADQPTAAPYPAQPHPYGPQRSRSSTVTPMKR